jgi:ferredoxin
MQTINPDLCTTCAQCGLALPDGWRGLVVSLAGAPEAPLCSDDCAEQMLRGHGAATWWPDGRIFMFSPSKGIREEVFA